MKRFLDNVCERFKSMRQGRSRTECDILPDDEGITVKCLTMENAATVARLDWRSIVSAKTFKRDLFTTDCVYLAFELADGWVELNEEMKGWRNLLSAIPKHLAGFPEETEWLQVVTQSPFAINERELWRRT